MLMFLRDSCNTALDRLIRIAIQVCGRSWPAFQVCGYSGVALAVILTLGLVAYRGLSPLIMVAIALAAMATFLTLAMATKIITGEEKLIYYHQEIAVMVVAALLLWALRQPVLAYLDCTILGIGAFLACGRIGCLMVGCCHGRPHAWGVCYRHEHAAAGFTPYYVGVRLFPIQAVESIWVFIVVAVGALLVLRGKAPGAALAWYIVAYDVGRFVFEFGRGDAARPYHLGFSQPQWLSLILTWLVVGAEAQGWLAFQPWRLGAASGLTLAMMIIALRRRGQDFTEQQVLHPHHVREIAHALKQADPALSASGGSIAVARTSLGIGVSGGLLPELAHYTLSTHHGALTDAAARRLADLIALLRHAPPTSEIVRGKHGIVHIVLPRHGDG